MALVHLDELQKAEIVSKSKLIPSVFIKTHYWIIAGNKSYYRGGRYRQVSLYLNQMWLTTYMRHWAAVG